MGSLPKFHILTAPGELVSIHNTMNPFIPASIKFSSNMKKLGWDSFIYASHTDGTVENTIDLKAVTTENLNRSFVIQDYCVRAGKEIKKLSSPGDIILCYYGVENKLATTMNSDLLVVEPSIGYNLDAVFCDHRIFTSNSQMNIFYGKKGIGIMEPSIKDCVIPNAFTVSEFEYSDKKEDYIIVFGRKVYEKGIKPAIEAALKAKTNIIIAGTGSLKELGLDDYLNNPLVKEIGLCNKQQRLHLLKNAKAVVGLTKYSEPFGNMVIEGYLSGTPAITSDWGAFSETVIEGVTGFRCRTIDEVVEAIHNIKYLSSKACRLWAEENYSEHIVHKKYDKYFKRLIYNGTNWINYN